jgi:hypothetical protein
MKMHIAVMGGLIGVGAALLLIIVEYLLLKRNAERRAVQKGKKLELDQSERKQFGATLRFAFFLPPAFALAAWMFW